MDLQRVTEVGLFDIKRAHQRISGFGVDIRLLQMADAFLVLSAGVPGFGDDGIARMQAGNRLLMRRKNTGVMVRINLQGRGQQRMVCEDSKDEEKSYGHACSML